MRRAILAVLLIVVAGCVTPSADDIPTVEPERDILSPVAAVYTLAKTESRRLASFDGTEIHVDLQFPNGTGPWPLLIRYTPYTSLGEQIPLSQYEADGVQRFMNSAAARYVPRGYVVATAHVRGTGESGGCLNVGGPEEGLDGYEIVEQLAAEPWSNGRVAMEGTSYIGTTPIATAVLNPPHLTTIIPKAGVTEWYRYYYENGEHRRNEDPPPGSDYTDPALWMALGAAPGHRTGTVDANDIPCTAEWTRQFLTQDDYNAYWKARNHAALTANITIPVLFTHGLDDGNVGSSMIPPFWYELTSEKRMWLTQLPHADPYSARPAFGEYEQRWLDYWMLDRETGALELPQVIIEDSEGRWRNESAWPPADAAPWRLHFAADGLVEAASAADGTGTWTDDGQDRHIPQTFGVSWLRYASEPLAAGRVLAGDVRVNLDVASTMSDGQYTLLLYAENETGIHFITRGHMDGRHRESLEQGKDMVPGTSYTLNFTMHPQDYNLNTGDRVVVVLKSSDVYILPDEIKAQHTIRYGEDSWIELPVVEPRETFASMDRMIPRLFRGPW